jgi:hypothetical protein
MLTTINFTTVNFTTVNFTTVNFTTVIFFFGKFLQTVNFYNCKLFNSIFLVSRRINGTDRLAVRSSLS